ncbi:MAG: hypothetical protein EOP48_22830 [Sphingobacteriales bacterium]|nr:MAG: hypothetical protein EOP48_22830 [Sphingobacteriales bacterium]
MLLFDEQNQEVDLEKFKADILNDVKLENLDEDNEESLEQDLAQMYTDALDSQFQEFDLNDEGGLEGITVFAGLGKKILEKIRKLVCPKLGNDASRESITDAVLEVIASILPGGKIIRFVIRKLVHFIIGRGVQAFCPAP